MAKTPDPLLLEILAKYGDSPEERLGQAFDRYGVQIADDCWLWVGSVDGSGYGQLSINGRSWRAHRLFYLLAFGVDPRGSVVMHKCDTPRCVQPGHLVLGTQRDNIADRHAKGRNGACRGDAAPWSALTSDQVQQLRERFAAGENRAALMAAFGISKTQLYRIANRESWVHI